jgi:hypothetical protein
MEVPEVGPLSRGRCSASSASRTSRRRSTSSTGWPRSPRPRGTTPTSRSSGTGSWCAGGRRRRRRLPTVTPSWPHRPTGSPEAEGSALQLVLGDHRAEVALDDLKRLKNRPLCQEIGVVLGALPVLAVARILGWKMSNGIPTPAARCCGVSVDGSCQLVVTTVAHMTKAVEMSVLRLDQAKPCVP